MSEIAWDAESGYVIVTDPSSKEGFVGYLET